MLSLLLPSKREQNVRCPEPPRSVHAGRTITRHGLMLRAVPPIGVTGMCAAAPRLTQVDNATIRAPYQPPACWLKQRYDLSFSLPQQIVQHMSVSICILDDTVTGMDCIEWDLYCRWCVSNFFWCTISNGASSQITPWNVTIELLVKHPN